VAFGFGGCDSLRAHFVRLLMRDDPQALPFVCGCAADPRTGSWGPNAPATKQEPPS
jgi:hypothetical protein